MTTQKVKINRAPVLTLWGVVVAERLGYGHNTALTLGKAIAGLNAQSKGRSLGIFEKKEEDGTEPEPKTQLVGRSLSVDMLGRSVPAVRTDKGIRATIKDQPIDPDSVERYLASKFGTGLAEVQAAMETLAKAYPPKRLADQAFALYEKFRPKVAEGTKGWGAVGELDLDRIRALAKPKK